MNKICKQLTLDNQCSSPYTFGTLPMSPYHLEICNNCNFREPPDKKFCTHLGRKFKKTSADEEQRFTCSLPNIKETTLKNCETCEYRVNKPYKIAPDNTYGIKSGVVIGAHNWPGLIELQIKTIRANCGNIPILISDDHSDGAAHLPKKGSRFYKMQLLSQKYEDVYFLPNAQRLGHSGGDLSAFWKGIYWAKNLKLDTLVKLSHRLVVDIPYWIQYYSYWMLKREVAVSSQVCDHNGYYFPIRSEGVILDVKKWYNPEILTKLTPVVVNEKEYVATVEDILWGIIKQHFGGVMYPLRIFRKYRYLADPGVLWHHSSTIQEYIDLADSYGVELDEDFTNIPSQDLKNYKGG